MREDGRKVDAFCRPSSKRGGLPSTMGVGGNRLITRIFVDGL